MEANNEHTDHVWVFLTVITQTHTHTHTMDRLPPGVDSVAVCEVDHIFNAVAVRVYVRVVGMLGVALKTLLWLLRKQKKVFFLKVTTNLSSKKVQLLKQKARLSWLWYWRKGGEASNKESRREGGHEWVSSFYLSLPKIQHSSSEGACQLSVMVLNVQTWKVQGGLIVIWGDYRLLLFNQI